jgi:hypothetical protein
MATSNVSVDITPPKVPPSDEATRSAPAKDTPEQLKLEKGIVKDDIDKVLDVVRKLKLSWSWRRMGILMQTLTGYEFLKGNHFFGFYPGTFQMFDAFSQYNQWSGAQKSGGKESADMSLEQLATNYCQMLYFAFVAALSNDTPRNDYSPEDPDNGEDRETAKAAGTVDTIIGKKNRRKTLHREKLSHFWLGGCYFEYTRFVVDADRFNTHKERVATVSQTQVVSDRYVCFNCGKATPLAAVKNKDMAACPNCKAPLKESGFFPGRTDKIPISEIKADVPNGMVLQSIYGPLHIDTKPDAQTLRDTPLLDLEEEVALGWLRTTYPGFYKELQEGMVAEDGQSQYARQARQLAATSLQWPGSYSTTTTIDPTFSRTWVQPWAFAYMDDDQCAAKLKKAYPKGMMIAHVGPLILQVLPACLMDEWSWAGTIKDKNIGLYPPPVGWSAVSVQKRFNDMAALIHDYMERAACGMVLVNAYYLDPKKMNRKRLLPGVLNPIALKRGQNVADIAKILHQFTFQIEQKIFEYANSLKFDMQLLVGTPPQIFGGDPGENVQTKGGQAQQLSTAKGKLSLFWEQIAEQEAEASEQGIECASENMTDAWWDTLTDKTEEFRKEYVHPDQMRGSIKVQHDETQGVPMSADELRQWWTNIMESQNKVIAAMLFKDPKNLDAAVRAFNIKGLVAPGQSAEAKCLHYIDKLMKSGPRIEMVMTPNGGQKVEVPTIQPDRFRDDLQAFQQIIRTWGDEHYDQLEANPEGDRNLLAFFKLCVEYDIQNKQVMAGAMPPPPPGATQNSAPSQAVQ